MARIFTTSVEFNHQKYDAIVTVTTQEGELNFNVRMLDPELHHLFPHGEVAYKGQDGFEALEHLDNGVAKAFMRRVADAIDKHLSPA